MKHAVSVRQYRSLLIACTINRTRGKVPRIRISECDRIGALFVGLGIDVVALLEGCSRVFEDVFGAEAIALHASANC